MTKSLPSILYIHQLISSNPHVRKMQYSSHFKDEEPEAQTG